MSSKFLPHISKSAVEKAKEASYDELYDLLAQPLHQELYERQTFDFMDELSMGQQLLLSYDYVRTQVEQGGFIQFIQNNYISLLPSMVDWLYQLKADDMAKLFDDVLKVYVLNRELINSSETLEQFALLYEELKEFEEIDLRFQQLNIPTQKIMLDYALAHLEEFIQ
jgi:Domain of unknown function (DUF4375)